MLKWEDVKDCVQARFINKARNFRYLRTLPYKSFLNLTVVFYIETITKEGMTRGTLISRSIARELGQNSERLFEQALKNLSSDDMCLLKFGDVAGVSEKSVDDMGMYVLTNKKKTLGSRLLLLKEVREKIIQSLGEAVYVIPSSVHEILLVPVSKVQHTSDELYKMVLEVNQTLHPMDVLADSLYMLDLDGTLSLVHGGTE